MRKLSSIVLLLSLPAFSYCQSSPHRDIKAAYDNSLRLANALNMVLKWAEQKGQEKQIEKRKQSEDFEAAMILAPEGGGVAVEVSYCERVMGLGQAAPKWVDGIRIIGPAASEFEGTVLLPARSKPPTVRSHNGQILSEQNAVERLARHNDPRFKFSTEIKWIPKSSAKSLDLQIDSRQKAERLLEAMKSLRDDARLYVETERRSLMALLEKSDFDKVTKSLRILELEKQSVRDEASRLRDAEMNLEREISKIRERYKELNFGAYPTPDGRHLTIANAELEEYYRAGYHYCTNFSNALSGKWIGNPYTMRQGRADYEWFTNLGKDVQSANRVQIANNHMRLAAGFKQAVDEISALKSRAATAKTKIPHLERQLRQLDSEGKELQSKLLQLQAEKREIDLRKGNLKTGERMLEMIDLEIDRAILAIAKVFPPEALTGNDLNHKQAELSLPQPPANPYDNQNRQPVLKIFPEPPANPFKGEK